MNRSYSLQALGLAIITVFGLAGCNEEIPLMSGKSNIAEVLPSFEMEGHAIDGLIRNGEVRIYDFSDGTKGALLGTSTTDANGLFTAQITGPSLKNGSYVISCVVSGDYLEEASGETITLNEGEELCAVKYFDPASNFNVVINPWSHYATALAQYKIKSGESVNNAIDSANTAIGTAYGFDVLDTVPRDLTDIAQSGQPYDDGMKMGSTIAGVSHFVKKQAEANGQDSHGGNFTSIKLHQTVYRDLLSDGKMDGQGLATDGKTTVTLGMGTETFDRNTFNVDIAKSTVEFIQSENNKTDIDTRTVLAEQERIAQSTSNVFGPVPDGQPLPSLDEEEPTLQLNIANQQYVAGRLDILGSARDFSGIKSVTVSVNGAETALTAQEAISYSIETAAFADGPLAVSFTVSDLLNNSQTTEFTLNVANDRPLFALMSDTLVNALSYDFSAQLSAIKAPIVSATVNGVAASVDGDGNLTATISLADGTNAVTVSVNDDIGQTFEYQASVDVDLEDPTVTLTHPAADYQVFFKQSGVSEPISQKMVFSSSANPFYIDRFHQTLDGTAITLANMDALNWPMIRFTASDIASAGGVSTATNELTVSYSFIDNGDEISSGTLNPVAEGEFILPLASEFLGQNWASSDTQKSLVITTADQAGNSVSSTYSFRSYLNNPELTSPIDVNSVLAGDSNSVQFTTSDFTGMDEVKFIIDGVEYVAGSATNPEFNVDVSTMIDGQHYGYVKAYKDGVEVYSQRVDFSVSNVPSIITVSTPQYVNVANPVIQGTATNAENGILSVSVGGTDANYNVLDDSFGLQLADLVEGWYSVAIEAMSGVNLPSTVTHEFAVDLTNPTLNVTDSGKAWRSGTTYTAQGTCTDLENNGVQSGVAGVTVNGEAAVCTDGAYTHTINVSEGANSVTTVLSDVAGNTDSSLVSFNIDNTKAAVSVTSSEYSASTNYTLTGTATDAQSGVTAVSVNGVNATYNSGDNTFSKALSGLVEGVHSIPVIATNGAELDSDAVNKSVIVDLTKPTVTHNGTSNWITSTSYTLTGTCTDPVSAGINSGVASLTVNNTSTACSSGAFSKSLTGLSQGTNNIPLVAVDNAGNQSNAVSAALKIDTIAPSGSITDPGTGWYTGTTYTINGTCSDASSGISSINVNGLSPACSSGSFSQSIPVTSGSNAITLNITDNAGLSTVKSDSVNIDNVSPSISVSDPGTTWRKGSTYTVTGSCSDSHSGISSVSINGQSTACSGSSYSKSISVSNGSNAISAIATDNAGLTSSANDTVNIDNLSPSGSINDPGTSWRTSGSYTVSGGCSDAHSGIASVTVNGLNAPCSGGSYSKVLTFTEGANPISSVFSDSAGNTTTVGETVYVDYNNPSIVTEGYGSLFEMHSSFSKGFISDIQDTTNAGIQYLDDYTSWDTIVNFSDSGSGVANVTFDFGDSNVYLRQSTRDGAGTVTHSDSSGNHTWLSTCSATKLSTGSYKLTCPKAMSNANLPGSRFWYISMTFYCNVDIFSRKVVATVYDNAGKSKVETFIIAAEPLFYTASAKTEWDTNNCSASFGYLPSFE